MNDTLKMQVKVHGDGVPLLLVGGGLTGWASWEPFVETFESKGRQVIRLQLLSVQYGLENRILPQDYSIKMESRALKATLDSLGQNGPLDVIAWSFGGLTSLDFALDHPDRIRTLTLIEPPAFWILREQGKLDATMQKISWSRDTTVTEDMLGEFLEFAGLMKPGTAPAEHPQWVKWLPFRQSLRNTSAVFDHRDDLDRLRLFSKPVLLVKGTGSSPNLHEIIHALHSLLPNSRLVEFPEGHAPHIVSRDQFLLEWDRFVE